ncbi:MBL fold metallo-hydrolase [Fibrella aquatilis]|uniref:MBL fold metallo-hydrolase n=1 Tax=Fibrella aquatilis TaxID=2817059 RepID=A0A939JZG4_9BACT|nr:MBL fold metallo-hydrolase [Fibrella aquatilis]MBO0930911.1 MBL fold metallo-hydrolase [Fibrella aquatilis]
MIKPLQQDNELLADIELAKNEPGNLHVWWLGQSGFLLQYNGIHLLFDPYLSDSLSVKYAQTDKPHTRMSERVIDPARLTMIDVVTSSHNHTDHLDADTLLPLFAASPGAQFVIPEANRAFVSDRLKCAVNWPIGLTAGQSVTIAGVTLHGVPAAHNELAVNDKGENLYMGFVAELGPYKVYHSGDTLWYDGIVDTLAPFGVDLAFLPINGNKPERRVAGNLNPDEAALLGRCIGARLVIPHHYDLFAFNTANPADFTAACHREGTPNRVMQLGGRVVVSGER